MRERDGERTLLYSVIASSPGPLVVGIGLALGRSSTQAADFVRRSAELAAIVASWLVFRAVRRGAGPARKAALERGVNAAVGGAMCVSAAAMAAVAIAGAESGHGTVIPGLAIAVLGVLANSWFWLRYARLDRRGPDAILRAQASLYRAKTVVDACVAAALGFVALAPDSPAAGAVDSIGAVAVACYLAATGIGLIRKASALGLPPRPLA